MMMMKDEMVLMMMLEMPNMAMVLVIRRHLIMPGYGARQMILASCLMIADDASAYESIYW